MLTHNHVDCGKYTRKKVPANTFTLTIKLDLLASCTVGFVRGQLLECMHIYNAINECEISAHTFKVSYTKFCKFVMMPKTYLFLIF